MAHGAEATTRAAWLVSAATIASAIVLVQTPPLARVLHLDPLHLGDWTLAGAGALIALLPLGVNRLWSGPRRA